jgi:hypothetical protein
MAIRTFQSGANRNSDKDKLDYEGFINPLTLKTFAEYMHKHRFLEDGSMRASDNWQKGIPQEEYVKSLIRHVMDLWLENRGYESREGKIDAVCGILFNAFGYLHEELKK